METIDKALEESIGKLILLEDICEPLLGYPYIRARYLASTGMINIPVFKLQSNTPRAPWFVHMDDLQRFIYNKRLEAKSESFDRLTLH